MKLEDLEQKWEEGMRWIDASKRPRHHFSSASQVLPGEEAHFRKGDGDVWVTCSKCGGNLIDCACPWPGLDLEHGRMS